MFPTGQSVNKPKVENTASASISWRPQCSLHHVVKGGARKCSDILLFKIIRMNKNVKFFLVETTTTRSPSVLNRKGSSSVEHESAWQILWRSGPNCLCTIGKFGLTLAQEERLMSRQNPLGPTATSNRIAIRPVSSRYIMPSTIYCQRQRKWDTILNSHITAVVKMFWSSKVGNDMHHYNQSDCV